MKCENKKNFLEHDGTNQLDRLLNQLVPDYILVNEKNVGAMDHFHLIDSRKAKILQYE